MKDRAKHFARFWPEVRVLACESKDEEAAA